jgi:2-amino-4-hydroxy-6-hydroxymethyldihydropteridine diphosphokinase
MAASDAFVALGSNMGEREAQLAFATLELGGDPGIEVVAASRVFETEAVGPPQGPYLNAVLRLLTSYGARELLDLLLAVERRAGRSRDSSSLRWGPRSLDLDLLLFDHRCIDEPGLAVPHPRLHERAFVLEPLCDLVPDWRHPVLNQSFSALAQRVRDSEAVRVWGPSELLVP